MFQLLIDRDRFKWNIGTTKPPPSSTAVAAAVVVAKVITAAKVEDDEEWDSMFDALQQYGKYL